MLSVMRTEDSAPGPISDLEIGDVTSLFISAHISHYTLFVEKREKMEVRHRRNNNVEKEEKITKLENELRKLKTPIETRINVNLCLLIYWLPG